MIKKADSIAWIGSMIMRVWLATVRFKLIDHAGVLQTPPKRPLLWTFWHNRLFVMAYMYQRFFPGRAGSALASASRDGEIISALMERFGIRAVRGSSSRGGGRALIEMKRAIEAGSIMAITPDGPRGPRYHINPGVIKLAQITEGCVVPIHVTYSSFWQLKSWDGFMIPKPFSSIEIIFDQLHQVPATQSEEAFEAERLRFQALLQRRPGLTPVIERDQVDV
ncbi:MAG: hypothetical protein JWL90_3331 [Chthoniobacteraceae bacterium]|nr:hypothetical protein [Chthoniobacteraceae bacterium]